eukprot:6206360-Pleurochrysis_carterae.AAC.1
MPDNDIPVVAEHHNILPLSSHAATLVCIACTANIKIPVPAWISASLAQLQFCSSIRTSCFQLSSVRRPTC